MPLSEAKTHLHELVRDLGGHDIVLVRHGRPVGVVVDFNRYRDLVDRAERAASTTGYDVLGELQGVRARDLANVCQARGVKRLVLFGSAARGQAGAQSDVDLLVAFEPMTPAEQADALFGLQDDLERLLRRPVDLLEEDAVHNPYLRNAIERDRKVLYDVA